MMAQPAPPASATSASASSSSLSATAAVPPPSAGGMGVFAGTSNGGWSYLPTAAPSATPSSLPTANPVAAGSPTGGWTVISRKNHNHHRTRPASVGYSSLLPPQAPPHQPSSTHHRLDPNRPESTALGVRQPQITRIAGPVVGDSHQLHDSSQTHSSLPGIAFQERLPSPFPPPGLQRPPELRKTYSAAVVHPLVSAAAPQPSPQITPTPDLYRSPTFGSSIPAMQSRLNPQQLSLAGQNFSEESEAESIDEITFALDILNRAVAHVVKVCSRDQTPLVMDKAMAVLLGALKALRESQATNRSADRLWQTTSFASGPAATEVQPPLMFPPGPVYSETNAETSTNVRVVVSAATVPAPAGARLLSIPRTDDSGSSANSWYASSQPMFEPQFLSQVNRNETYTPLGMQFSAQSAPSEDFDADRGRKASFSTFSDEDAYQFRRTPRRRTLSWADIINAKPSRGEFPLKVTSPQPTKRSPTAVDLEKKQTKAQELRESLLSDKKDRLRTRTEKIQAVKQSLQEQAKQLKEALEAKQARAEKKREEIIKGIQEKAKDEVHKLEEIALVSATHLETRKQEVHQRHLESEARLIEMSEERQRKALEAAALQEAVLERKRAQEAEWLAKIAKEEERRKDMEAKRESDRIARLAQRVAQREEKRRKLAELRSVKQAEEEEERRELHEKLSTRLEQGSKRHDEMLEQKKEKAAAANAKVTASLFNARKLHEDGGLRWALVLPSGFAEPVLDKSQKRRIKRIRQNLREIVTANTTAASKRSNRSGSSNKAAEKEFDGIEAIVQKLGKSLPLEERDYALFANDSSTIVLPPASLTAVLRLCVATEVQLNGSIAIQINLWFWKTIRASCQLSTNVECVLRSLEFSSLAIVDSFSREMSQLADSQNLEETVLLLAEMLAVLVSLLRGFSTENGLAKAAQKQLVSYIICVDIVDRLSRIFSSLTSPAALSESSVIQLLNEGMKLLECVSSSAQLSNQDNSLQQVVEAFKKSDLASIVTTLVALVLREGGGSRTPVDEEQPERIVETSARGLSVLNNLSVLDLETVQNLLASEGVQPQFFHLAVFWLRYHQARHPFPKNPTECSSYPPLTLTTAVLHELIVLLGYASLSHQSNRSMLRFGQGQQILHYLSSLPFSYFSDEVLTEILIPTLVAACEDDPDNTGIVEDQVGWSFLEGWVRERNQCAGAEGDHPSQRRQQQQGQQQQRDWNGLIVANGAGECCWKRFVQKGRLPQSLLQRLSLTT